VLREGGVGRRQSVRRGRDVDELGPGKSELFDGAALEARVATNARNGAEAVRVGSLQARRDFTDVRDVVRAYRLLAEHADAGEVFNVCCGPALSVAELAQQLVDRAAHPMRLMSDGSLIRPVDLLELRGDPSKLRHATGWQPDITLEQTRDDLLNHWRQKLAKSSWPAAP